jgi:transcriptional regulator with XRE-family HTH domain
MGKRLTDNDVLQRLNTLQKNLTQKKLLEKLGITKYRYNKIRQTQVFEKETKTLINKLYNQYKTTTRTNKRKDHKKRTTPKTIRRYDLPIYPDYMFKSPASRYSDVFGFDRLETLHDSGYMATYYGLSNTIPIHVQFTIHGEDIRRFEKNVYIVGIVSLTNSDKPTKVVLMIKKIACVGIKGFNKKLKASERLQRLVDYYFDEMPTSKNIKTKHEFLGFYFKENETEL